MSFKLPNELWLDIFYRLTLADLLSAYRVDRHWRSMVPNISESVRLKLFRLAIEDILVEQPSDTPHTVTLHDRLSYVMDIEMSFDVLIPDPYRTCLMEWPVRRPPPRLHWPHAVRFHASGFCSCLGLLHRECYCHDERVQIQRLTIKKGLLGIIRRHEEFDYHSSLDARYELFSNPPRLSTDSENEQTLRFIRIHPSGKMWSDRGSWADLSVKALRLSRYITGEFWMILEGPTRGEIHGWSESTWYDGFEATSFLGWRYEEWKQDDGETEIREWNGTGRPMEFRWDE